MIKTYHNDERVTTKHDAYAPKRYVKINIKQNI